MNKAEVTQSPEIGCDTREDEMEQQEDDGVYESGDSMPPLKYVEDSDDDCYDVPKELPDTVGAVIF